jgi:hypothetical protein
VATEQQSAQFEHGAKKRRSLSELLGWTTLETDDPSKTLHAQNQVALIDFLTLDLDLAFTILRTAEMEAKDHPEHYRSALTKVQAALDTIQSLGSRIEDLRAWTTIHDRANELKSAFEAVSR